MKHRLRNNFSFCRWRGPSKDLHRLNLLSLLLPHCLMVPGVVCAMVPLCCRRRHRRRRRRPYGKGNMVVASTAIAGLAVAITAAHLEQELERERFSEPSRLNPPAEAHPSSRRSVARRGRGRMGRPRNPELAVDLLSSTSLSAKVTGRPTMNSTRPRARPSPRSGQRKSMDVLLKSRHRWHTSSRGTLTAARDGTRPRSPTYEAPADHR